MPPAVPPPSRRPLHLRLLVAVSALFAALTLFLLLDTHIYYLADVVSLALAIPLCTLTIYLYRAHERREFQALWGHCLHCGYNLSHSATRCPECGHPFQNAEDQA